MPNQPPVPNGFPRVSWFTRFAKLISYQAGRPSAFFLAVVVVAGWAITGPMFHYSDTWQLVINTGTTIATFLMVFLIQNTQYRDSQAIHMKLDELIRVKKGARNTLLNLEDLSDQELEQLRVSFNEIAERAKLKAQNGETQTDVIAVLQKK